MRAVLSAGALRGAAVSVALVAVGCGLQLSGLDTTASDAGASDAAGHPRPMADATQPTSSSSSGVAASGDGNASDADEDSGDDGAPDAPSGSDSAEPDGDDGEVANDAKPQGDSNPADDDGSTSDDGGASDDSSIGPADSGLGFDSTTSSDAGGGGSGSDAGDGATTGSCAGMGANCVVVPDGWSLVAFAPSQAATCPSGFGSTSNLVENPSATATSCGCGTCSTTTQPSCNAGAIGVNYDVALSVNVGTCNAPGTPPMLENSPAGSCGTDLDVTNYSLYDVEFVAPPASGGVCTAPGTTGALTFGAHDRSCTPSSPAAANCAGDVCSPTLGGPYSACITPTTSGVSPCPPGPLGVQHVVGTAAAFSCSACPCTVSATCSAGTVTLYTNGGCARSGTAFTTGECTNVAFSAGDVTFDSYKFRGGNASAVTCSATPGTPQNVSLTNETTICCAN